MSYTPGPVKVIKVCTVCGNTLGRQRVQYCSRACMAVGYASSMQGRANPNFREADKACQRCGVVFHTRDKARKFCGRACYAADSAGRLREMGAALKERQRLARLAKLCRGCHVNPVPRLQRQMCDACKPKPRRPTSCAYCGVRLAGHRKICHTCRLRGAHLAPPRTSTCTTCEAVVNKPNRKYCDRCFLDALRAMRTTPRRVDANQREIVEALEKCGCHVLDLSHVGRGCPDILVSDRKGVLHLLEIKVKNGRLNERQKRWHDEWRGRKPVVVRTVDEALAAVGIGIDGSSIRGFNHGPTMDDVLATVK